jgi:16S rRNA (adenine1518-N6/adenine1519-N6)-dimethyltransferase
VSKGNVTGAGGENRQFADRVARTAPGGAVRLLGPRRLRELLEAHEIRPRRGLGQNFVVDPNTIRKMLDVAGVGRTDRVLEIGAGAGSLTLGLAERAARVTAVEFDPRLIAVLREVVGGASNVQIIEADALRLDLESIDAEHVVGNLPYNIAATLVLRVLEDAPDVRDLAVMTQREVGERLVANPGSKVYGQTSVLVDYFADAQIRARVSRRAFYPVPKVDSVIVKITRRSELPDVDRDRLFNLVRTVFAQRRKMLRSTVSSLTSSSEEALRALGRAGIDSSARPETLGLQDFVTLTRSL